MKFAIIISGNAMAWGAIKNKHPRYSLDDGKIRHTRLQWL